MLALYGGDAMLPSNNKEDLDYVVVNREDPTEIPRLRFHANGWWSVRKPDAQLTNIHDILMPHSNEPNDVLQFYALRIDPDFAMTIAERMQDALGNVSDDEIFSGQGVVFEEMQMRFNNEKDKYVEENKLVYLNRINAGLHAGLGRVLGVDRLSEGSQRNSLIYPDLPNT